MSRMNMEDSNFFDCVLQKGVKGGVNNMTIAGAITWDRDSPLINVIDQGGTTRVITMPAAERGLMFIMHAVNAANDLTISDPLGPTTRGTISPTETAIVYSDGVRWYVGVMTTT